MAEPGFEPTVSSMVILPGSSARGSESSGAPGSVMSTAWPDLSMSSLCDSCGGLALVGASSLRLRQSLPRCPPRSSPASLLPHIPPLQGWGEGFRLSAGHLLLGSGPQKEEHRAPSSLLGGPRKNDNFWVDCVQ